MPRSELAQRRPLLVRARLRLLVQGASGVEPAAQGGIERAWKIAFEQDRRLGALPSRMRDDGRREQRLGVGMLGRAKELCPGRRLDDLAEVHDGDPVAQELDGGQVVRDEEAREAHPALEIAEQVEDRGLNRDVQGGYRLSATRTLGSRTSARAIATR